MCPLANSIVPQDYVLDEALRAMSESNTQLTVDSFIRTLASLDTNASPRPQQRPALSVAVPPPGSAKKVSFTTLESPSTPSSLPSPSFRLPSPPQAAAAPVAVPGLFYSSPAPHAAPAPRPPLSAVRPGQHLGSISRSFSAPVIPTLGTVGQAQAGALPTPPTAPSSGSLFGAAAGMGRVATRRGNLGALGADSRQQQAAASSPRRSNFGSPAPPPPPAAATPAPSSSLLPAFAFGTASTSSDKPARSAALPSSSSTSRLSKLQSWLAQDDEGTSEDDDDSKGPGATAAGAEAMLKAAAATSKVAAAVPAPAALQLVDAPPSDDDRDAAAGRPRVGGKSIHGLRHRRASEEQQSQPPSLVAASGGQAQGMTTRRRASAKGKGRAVPECVCGASAEGSSSGAVVCAECEVAFHVACVDGASASPFTCSRCAVLADDGPASSGPAKGSDSAAEKEPATAATTPKLADKRVRIGINTTPHLYQEPTLVASTPVSAPRGNNFSHCADMALAPSPTASPVRRFVPTSPVPSAARLPIPVTPHFGEATIQRAPAPGDYSPTSPQNYRTRASRTRMMSGGAFLNGEWLNSSWDTPSSGAAHAAFGGEADVAQQEQPLRHARATTPVNSGGLSSLVNDDGGAGADEWQLPAWSDVTMTPSRALTSSATPGLSSSASSSVWDTPFAHASPHAHLRRANSSYHAPGVQTLGGHFRTPSQDFLAALERDHPSAAAEAGQGTEAHHMFAQRLFGGHEGQSSPYDDAHQQGAFSSSSPQRPPSPLNPRRVPSYGNTHGYAAQYPHHQQHQHQHQQPYKSPSLGDGLANPWSLGGAVAHERMALSASMKPSFSAPGVARFAHGGYGHHHEAAAVEQQMLDDLLV